MAISLKDALKSKQAIAENPNVLTNVLARYNMTDGMIPTGFTGNDAVNLLKDVKTETKKVSVMPTVNPKFTNAAKAIALANKTGLDANTIYNSGDLVNLSKKNINGQIDFTNPAFLPKTREIVNAEKLVTQAGNNPQVLTASMGGNTTMLIVGVLIIILAMFLFKK